MMMIRLYEKVLLLFFLFHRQNDVKLKMQEKYIHIYKIGQSHTFVGCFFFGCIFRLLIVYKNCNKWRQGIRARAHALARSLISESSFYLLVRHDQRWHCRHRRHCGRVFLPLCPFSLRTFFFSRFILCSIVSCVFSVLIVSVFCCFCFFFSCIFFRLFRYKIFLLRFRSVQQQNVLLLLFVFPSFSTRRANEWVCVCFTCLCALRPFSRFHHTIFNVPF